MDFDIVVACDLKRGIGKAHSLPWKLSADLKYFRQLTCATKSGGTNAVVMGRKTWESIPQEFRPLKARLNIVLTRDGSYVLPAGVLLAGRLDEAIVLAQNSGAENCFVIGGGDIYRQALVHPCLSRIYLTQIKAEFGCDTFFPEYEDGFEAVTPCNWQCENGLEYSFQVFKRKDKSCRQSRAFCPNSAT